MTKLQRPRCVNHPTKTPIVRCSKCSQFLCGRCYNEHVAWDPQHPRQCESGQKVPRGI